jgi:hypothetical protein
MELPGLAKALYGMTRVDAIRAGICIDCKKDAKWYSPAGKAEYQISGLCEPCFDKITGEPEEETMKTLSDVTGVIQNDHALYAEQFLEDNNFADDWEVVVADDKMLMLDYDDRPYDGTLPEQFYVTLGIFEEMVGHDNYFQHTPSKGGNTHAVLHMNTPMPIVERIAWQAAFGSDPKREALHLLSVSRGELNPILLFMRKDRTTTGVDENGNNRMQCSKVLPPPTMQDLIDAGVPGYPHPDTP